MSSAPTLTRSTGRRRHRPYRHAERRTVDDLHRRACRAFPDPDEAHFVRPQAEFAQRTDVKSQCRSSCSPTRLRQAHTCSEFETRVRSGLTISCSESAKPPRSHDLVQCDSVHLARRSSNTRLAKLDSSAVPRFSQYEQESFAARQPLRIDLDRMLHDAGYIDVLIDPGPP